MSSTPSGRPPQVISLHGSSQGSPQGEAGGIFEKLEGMLQAARNLETQLGQERHKTRQLAEDLKSMQTTYDRLLQESEARSREAQIRSNQAGSAYAVQLEREKRIIAQARALHTEFQKVSAELNHYKKAWSGVLLREREAKSIILESQDASRRLIDAENRLKELEGLLKSERAHREQAERHSRSYQSELQNALVRLHSAEGKFSELSKEYQLVRDNKRNFEQEVARVELSMRERFQWELIKERERIKAELERESAQERERFREELLAERDRHREDARSEVRAQYEDRLDEQRAQFQGELARLQGELEARAEESRKLRVEAAAARLDGESRASSARAESEARTRELQARVDQASAYQSVASAQLEEAMKESSELEASLEQGRQELVKALDQAAALRLDLDRERSELECARSELTRIQDRETELRASLAGFEAAFTSEFERSRSLEKALIEEKARFHLASDELERELSEGSLLTVRLDIERLQTRLKDLGTDPGTPRRLEKDIAELIQEREQLRKAIADWNRSLSRQSSRIRLLAEANTILAQPGEEPDLRSPQLDS
jgi:chromosome segregation ATPase